LNAIQALYQLSYDPNSFCLYLLLQPSVVNQFSHASSVMAKKKAAPQTPSLFDNEPAAATEPHANHIPHAFPPSWTTPLATEFAQPYFAKLLAFVADERTQHDIFPADADVFNAFTFTPFEQVKVVLLGQDPYPTPGHAHGLCFSVRPGVALPASLRNIYTELKTDLGLTPPKHGYLAAWARQGVLMLNTVLTVRSGTPASHAKKGWETFTDAVLAAVNAGPRPVVFVLWGGHAQKKAPLIDTTRHAIVQSAHPSPLSASNGFFGSKPFSKINAALAERNIAPIDWALPTNAQ
jgi:uracil-DNA glycosylase